MHNVSKNHVAFSYKAVSSRMCSIEETKQLEKSTIRGDHHADATMKRLNKMGPLSMLHVQAQTLVPKKSACSVARCV